MRTAFFTSEVSIQGETSWPKSKSKQQPQPAFLFDLDGTLIDSVYEHILAWRRALSEMGIELSNWFIHRRIGMSDSLSR
jgi:hypothetical protein